MFRKGTANILSFLIIFEAVLEPVPQNLIKSFNSQ